VEKYVWSEAHLDAFHKKCEALADSNIMMTLVGPDPNDLDIQQCLEIGAAVLLDKPFMVIVPKDRKVPENLKKIASVIVHGLPGDPGFDETLKEAFDYMAREEQ
jgi:hypothetical protein